MCKQTQHFFRNAAVRHLNSPVQICREGRRAEEPEHTVTDSRLLTAFSSSCAVQEPAARQTLTETLSATARRSLCSWHTSSIEYMLLCNFCKLRKNHFTIPVLASKIRASFNPRTQPQQPCLMISQQHKTH